MKTMKDEKKTLGKKWFSHVLKTAKKSYKKHKGGEESSDEETMAAPMAAPVTAPMGGRKHRRGGKTQRRRK
jgi:hypothetical protein